MGLSDITVFLALSSYMPGNKVDEVQFTFPPTSPEVWYEQLWCH